MSPRDFSIVDPHLQLSRISLFGGLPLPLLKKLGSASRVLELPANQRVFAVGDPVREAHFLVSGAVKRSVQLPGDAEKVLELVEPGCLFALSEVISTRHHASSSETISPSVVLAIEVEPLLDAARTDPLLSWRLLDAMAQHQYRAELGMVSHHTHLVTQRVLNYLLTLAGPQRDIAGETTVRLDTSKRLIAARLDMAPETFSRTLRQLSRDGLVVVEGRTVHIQNATLAGGPTLQQGKAAPLRYRKMDRSLADDARSPAALVNLCGRYRMLSQRMATAWCMVARRITTSAARITLRRHREQFERNLVQMTALPLSPRARTSLKALTGAWGKYRALLMTPSPSWAGAEAVFDLSEKVLGAADRLTATVAGDAGTDAVLLVNVAGRNRMLTARLTKLFLFCDWGVQKARSLRCMKASRQEFAANIRLLQGGGEGTPEASAQLAIDLERWQHFLQVIDANPAPSSHNGHARAVFAASEELLRHVDTTVKLYEHLAQRS